MPGATAPSPLWGGSGWGEFRRAAVLRLRLFSIVTESPPPSLPQVQAKLGFAKTGGGVFEYRSSAKCAALGAVIALQVGAAQSGELAREAIVTNQPADSLSVVDLDTMKSVAEIKIGGKPAGIALSPDKKTAYITAPEAKELIEVDATSRTVKRRLALTGGPLGIAAHPSRAEVYVADWYEHKIAVIDAEKLTVAAEIPVGQSPSGLAVTPDGALLLSADRDSNEVSFIDLASRKRLGGLAVGERPFGITIDSTGARAYTANVASDDVSVIDIAARKVVGTVKAGHKPYAVALAKGKGFVTGQYSGTVEVFDATSLAPVATIEACDHPEGIEADGKGETVYVACWGDNIMLKIDAGSLKITGKADVGDGPRAFGKFLR